MFQPLMKLQPNIPMWNKHDRLLSRSKVKIISPACDQLSAKSQVKSSMEVVLNLLHPHHALSSLSEAINWSLTSRWKVTSLRKVKCNNSQQHHHPLLSRNSINTSEWTKKLYLSWKVSNTHPLDKKFDIGKPMEGIQKVTSSQKSFPPHSKQDFKAKSNKDL